MPDSDLGGFELAQEARDRKPSLRCSATGGIVSVGMKVLYVDGAKMLPKPYTDVELEDAILGDVTRTLIGANERPRQAEDNR